MHEYQPRLGRHCDQHGTESEPCWGAVRTNSDHTWLCEGHRGGYCPKPKPFWQRQEPTPEPAWKERLSGLSDAKRWGFWSPRTYIEWMDKRVRLIGPYGTLPLGLTGIIDDWEGGWPTITWEDARWISTPLSHLEWVEGNTPQIERWWMCSCGEEEFNFGAPAKCWKDKENGETHEWSLRTDPGIVTKTPTEK